MLVDVCLVLTLRTRADAGESTAGRVKAHVVAGVFAHGLLTRPRLGR